MHSACHAPWLTRQTPCPSIDSLPGSAQGPVQHRHPLEASQDAASVTVELVHERAYFRRGPRTCIPYPLPGICFCVMLLPRYPGPCMHHPAASLSAPSPPPSSRALPQGRMPLLNIAALMCHQPCACQAWPAIQQHALQWVQLPGAAPAATPQG